MLRSVVPRVVAIAHAELKEREQFFGLLCQIGHLELLVWEQQHLGFLQARQHARHRCKGKKVEVDDIGGQKAKRAWVAAGVMCVRGSGSGGGG